MNDNDNEQSNVPNVPPPITPIQSFVMSPDSPPPIPNPSRPLSWWLRKFLACNPFYLVSAALLLYGCYRISIDPGVQGQNSLHLFFNFGSIQFYELLLV